MSQSIPTYKCPKCGQRKLRTAEFFYRDKHALDGLTSYCKTCKLAYQKELDKRRTRVYRWTDAAQKRQRRYRERKRQAERRAKATNQIYKGVDLNV